MQPVNHKLKNMDVISRNISLLLWTIGDFLGLCIMYTLIIKGVNTRLTKSGLFFKSELFLFIMWTNFTFDDKHSHFFKGNRKSLVSTFSKYYTGHLCLVFVREDEEICIFLSWFLCKKEIGFKMQKQQKCCIQSEKVHNQDNFFVFFPLSFVYF